MREASDGGLALEGRSEEGGFCAGAAVPVNEEAFEVALFDAHLLKADSGAQPNSLPDWTPTQPSMRGATE